MSNSIYKICGFFAFAMALSQHTTAQEASDKTIHHRADTVQKELMRVPAIKGETIGVRLTMILLI